MVKSCCIKKCKSEWTKNGEITFHCFPKDPELLKKFVAAVPPGLLPKITKHSVICSKHFTFESFHPIASTQLRNRLKREAVPTLFYDDCNSSVINTKTNEVIRLIDDDDPDNEEAVESIPSTFIINGVPLQETVLNNDSSHIEMPESNISPTTKKDVGVQTSEKYLPPSDEVIQLRRKIKILQNRLRRREIRLKTMNNVIEYIQSNDSQ